MSFLLSLLLSCSGSSSPEAGLRAGDPGRPDIILISIDTLRADHVGAYGYERDTTPFIDQLAAQGRRYADARSPSPWTLPTHLTMLSGQLPVHHQVVDAQAQIAPETPLLAEALSSADYATGGFVSTLFVSERFGFERGFSVFDDFDIDDEKKNLQARVDAEDVVDSALRFTSGQDGEAVFLFLHLYDAHYPYKAPEPWDTHFDRAGTSQDSTYKNYFHYLKRPLSEEQLAHQVAQYDEEIRYVDAQIQRMVESLRGAGRDPIILITSDHGEEFFERGSWGHAHTLNPEQLHVPLILAGPGIEPAVITEPVGTQDIPLTLASLAGAEMPAGDGVSLLGTLDPARALLFDTSRFDTNRLGLYQGGLRLDWDLKTRTGALYADTFELLDVAAERPEDVARLQATLGGMLGTPWQGEKGVVTSKKGVFFVDGAMQKGALRLGQGTAFAVVPLDATMKHNGDGPYSVSKGGGPMLRFMGSAAVATELSEAARAQLEALGYMQGEDE